MGPSSDLLSTAALFIVTTLLLSAILPARAQLNGIEGESGFSYVEGAPNGPEHWGDLKPEWATCGKGLRQSPIDLSDSRGGGGRDLRPIDPDYRPTQATIVNRGHDIMLRFDGDAGSLAFNGTRYQLRQLHWHAPSEHTINGRRYDLEMHMVHQTAGGKVAVLGFVYDVARGGGCSDDPFLRDLEPFIRRVSYGCSREERVGVVNPRHVRGFLDEYYRYMGSLTTPPCTEGVVWTVLKLARPVSMYQVHLLQQAVNQGMQKNARPLQKANNRDISIFWFTKLLESF